MRKSAIAAAVLAATTPAAGCRLDLTEIRTPSGVARVYVQLQTESGVPPSLIAAFSPGMTPDGGVRPVGDDSPHLDGVSIPPESVDDEGTRFYTVPALDPAASSFRVRVPTLLDATESPPEVLVTPIRVVAPDTLNATRPGSLQIPLSGTDVNVAGASSGSWSVRIYSDTANTQLLFLSIQTRPDSLLSVPTELLPPDVARGRIDVQGSVRDTLTSVGGAYRFDVERKFAALIPFRIEY